MSTILKSKLVSSSSPHEANLVGGKPTGAKINPQLRGEPGKNATITIGTVESVPSDSPAEIINSGDKTDAILNFKIPRGIDGATPTIGENGNWFLDGVDTGISAGVSAEISELLNTLFENNKFAHSITIGEHIYDGSQDVVIAIYNGEVSDEEILITALSAQRELKMKDTSQDAFSIENNGTNMMMAVSTLNTMNEKNGTNMTMAVSTLNTMKMTS